MTSDHGEALFEAGGGLGHGLSLDHAQTQVPLVVFGLPGDWPEPIGMSDLRGALQRALQVEPAEKPPRPRFAPGAGPPDLPVHGVDRASRACWVCARPTRSCAGTPSTRRCADPDFQTLIWWWESLQLETAAGAR